MRTIRTVMNSDTVNRYGMRFTVAALESGLRQAWNPGLPGFISHDRHRPVEWNRATGIYLEPGMARLFGISMFPETSEEAQWVERQCNAALNSKHQEHVAPHIDHMTKCLNPYLSSQAKWMHLECPAVVDDGIAKRLAPELFENADKDGLTFLKDLNPIAPGVFQYGEWAIFAHSFFRRSLSRHNSTNAPFLERLNALQNNELVTARIALDPDVVGLAQEYLEPVELQYWWGPKFDDSIANIPRGVTRHEADEIQRLFHGVSRTEFWWYQQDEFCVFESEEVLDAASLGVSDSFYGCRYVHSMVNAELNVVTHMDGAIRGYDEDTIIKRIDSDIIKAGRRSKYSKLWRVDGELSVEEWKSLLSDFYRDNVLVGEYLGG